MERHPKIRKITKLLELGFHFKCIRLYDGEIEIYKENEIYYVTIENYRVYPLKIDVEEIANIIYDSEYYVFSNSKDSLTDLIENYNYKY